MYDKKLTSLTKEIAFSYMYLHEFKYMYLFSSLFNFYAPRKISGEHIVAALSVRLSVRPPVPFSCPGHNSKSIRGINMKLCR
jgi:hypothetical protein